MASTGWTVLHTRIARLRTCIRQTDLLLTRASSVLVDTSHRNAEATFRSTERAPIAFIQFSQSANGSSLWYAAGAATAVAQTILEAHAEEDRVESTPSPNDAGLVSNRSTAQWRVYTNLARDLWQKGDREAAERYMRRALEEAKKGFGEDDGHVAAAYNNLAEVLRNSRQFEKAEPLYLEGLRVMELAYGRKDQRYALSLHYIAGFYQTQGKFDISRQYYRMSLQAVEDSLGKNHPMYTMVLTSFADTERLAGQKKEAIALLSQALKIQDSFGPSQLSETLQVASKLGQMQIMDGQLEEGLTTLRRCVMQAEEHYSPESRGYATALPQHLEVLAEGLQRSGDLMGARDLLHKAMGLRRGKGPGSISLPLTMLSTAEIELKLGESTGKQDSYLRAHNLASQTIEKYRKAMQGFAAPNVNKQQSQSWWSKLFQQEEVKQKAPPYAPTIHCVRAVNVLAIAQEKLGRTSEAQQSLVEGLEMLDRLGSRQLPADTLEASLKANEREISLQLEQEMAHLQLAVSLLYSLFRLAQNDSLLKQNSSVMSQLSVLRSRLPGIEGAPTPEVPNVKLTPSLAEVWTARQQLNELQDQINQRKRQLFARS